MPLEESVGRELQNEEEIEMAAVAAPSAKVERVPLMITTTPQLRGVAPIENVYRARRLLYLSHSFAQFSEVVWQFCLTIFLAAVTDYKSLILVSTYGIMVSLSVSLAGAKLGGFIDASDRLFVARIFILLENVSVVVATILCFILLSTTPASHGDDANDIMEKNWLQKRFQYVPLDATSILLLIMIHILGSLAQVLDQAFLVAIERDWVVVLSRTAAISRSSSQGEGSDTVAESSSSVFSSWLSETNVAMKQIDLTCKVAGPTVAGFLLPLMATRVVSSSEGQHAGDALAPSQTDLRWACIVVGAVNVLALVAEYVCTARIYTLIPALGDKADCQGDENAKANICDEDNPANENEGDVLSTAQEQDSCCRELAVYLQQPIAWGGLGLALLYLNSLTFGNGIMTTYLLYVGIDLQSIGLLRGAASAIGLLGTCVYHFSVKRLSLESTGMWSVLYQFNCLVMSFASLYVREGTISVTLLVAGVCLSRIGLWVFDIAVTQMQQEEIPDGIRGAVGGVQQALNSFCGIMSFVLGFLFPNPKDFHIYVGAALISVGCAVISFAAGVYYPRTLST